MPAPTKKPTPKQLQILQMASEGKTFEAMAREIGVTLNTLNTRARRVYRKLGVNSLPHAVALVILTGDIPGPLVCDGHG